MTGSGVTVHATSTDVEITVVSASDENGSGCADQLVVGNARVDLDEALGDRDLLHAPTDPAWPRSLVGD